MDASTDRSSQKGMHATKTMSMRQRNATVRPPPGLTGPPGLEPVWSAGQGLPATPHADTCWNTQATCFMPANAPGGHIASSLYPNSLCFVPGLGAIEDPYRAQAMSPESQKSQQLRQSIHMLKGALQGWEANLPATNPTTVQQQRTTPATSHDHLGVLQQALTKLTPEEAFAIRTFLDEKAKESTPELTKDALPQGAQKGSSAHAGRNRSDGMQRPFAPFGGAQAPGEQSKQSKVPVTARSTYLKGKLVQAGVDESLRDHLRELADIDTKRVLMVRKINKLGLESSLFLKEYFSQFGSVEKVMVAHTRVRAKGLEKARIRPAPLGFVVLSNTEEANAALAQGAEHSVKGVDIGVFSFESHPADESTKHTKL